MLPPGILNLISSNKHLQCVTRTHARADIFCVVHTAGIYSPTLLPCSVCKWLLGPLTKSLVPSSSKSSSPPSVISPASTSAVPSTSSLPEWSAESPWRHSNTSSCFHCASVERDKGTSSYPNIRFNKCILTFLYLSRRLAAADLLYLIELFISPAGKNSQPQPINAQAGQKSYQHLSDVASQSFQASLAESQFWSWSVTTPSWLSRADLSSL